MRYVLFATSRFGALTLESLIAQGIPPLALVTHPDRPAGRDKTLTPTPAKQVALANDIPCYAPETLPEIYDALRSLNADCFVIASFGKILRQELIDIPPKGIVCIHPSLLPHYRGPAPIQQSIIDGVTETGVTLFVIDTEIDHGPIIGQEKIVLTHPETNISLEEKLAKLSATLTSHLLPGYIADTITPIEQDHTQATYTHKFTTQDGYIPWEQIQQAIVDGTDSANVRNRIAGLYPEPGAWTERDGTRIKLIEAVVEKERLVITRYQKAGKNITNEIFKI